MNIPILNEKIILSPSDLNSLCPDFRIIGVFNPGVVRFNEDILLLVRVVEQPTTTDAGRLHSPRAIWPGGKLEWVLDTFPANGADTHDPRLFRLPDGNVRLRYISHLRLVHLNADCTQIKDIQILPDLLPREKWEEFGIEDARISKIGDVYYITYVAISREMGISTALMTTHDFRTFDRHGIIFPTENKDVVLLPEKWQDYFVAYHRPVSNSRINLPSIETSLSPDAIYWGRHQFLFGPGLDSWGSVKVGAGPPPLRIPEGWLLIYHEVAPPTPESPVGEYCLGFALMDGKNPLRLIARSDKPLICPERPYEIQGFAPNVLFPTGALLSEDKESILLFNGAADEVVAMLQIPIKSIIDHLRTFDK